MAIQYPKQRYMIMYIGYPIFIDGAYYSLILNTIVLYIVIILYTLTELGSYPIKMM